MCESDWIKGAKRGDPICLTALIESNYKSVYRYIYRLTFDQMLSEDITQETFTRFIMHLERYVPTAKLSTYLITIASNLLKDHYKKSKSAQSMLESMKGQAQLSATSKGDTHLILEETLMHLDVESRSVILLHDYYGYPLSEISEMLKIPIGTVKSKRHYALKALKEDGLYE